MMIAIILVIIVIYPFNTCISHSTTALIVAFDSQSKGEFTANDCGEDNSCGDKKKIVTIHNYLTGHYIKVSDESQILQASILIFQSKGEFTAEIV